MTGCLHCNPIYSNLVNRVHIHTHTHTRFGYEIISDVFLKYANYFKYLYLQAKCGFPGDLLKGNLCSIPLCRFWKGSGQVGSFDLVNLRLSRSGRAIAVYN